MPHKVKKTVLITGATGFIGKYIIEQALKSDYEVFIAVRKESDTSRINGLNFKKILVDFSSEETINTSFSSTIVFDTVVHNAGVKTCLDKDNYYKFNTELTRNLCKVLHKRKALTGKFIFISSLAAIGPGDKEVLEDITESKEEKPISQYGHSKLLAEKEVLKSGLDFIILRPTAVYGMGTSDYTGLIKVVRKGWAIYMAEPSQHLSFVHAEDLARIVFLADNITNGNQIFNVSDSIDYTLESFYEIVASGVGVKTKFKVRVPFFIVKNIAQFNHYTEKFLKIENALNSIEKANEVTALNWKCSAEKLVNAIGFTATHSLMEIID